MQILTQFFHKLCTDQVKRDMLSTRRDFNFKNTLAKAKRMKLKKSLESLFISFMKIATL